MIDRLEDAGLVERRRDPDDRRAWRIHLTDRARPLIGKLRDIADTVTGEALADLAPADLQALEQGLRTIRHNLAQPPQDMEASHG